jgi:hypothetical protein
MLHPLLRRTRLHVETGDGITCLVYGQVVACAHERRLRRGPAVAPGSVRISSVSDVVCGRASLLYEALFCCTQRRVPQDARRFPEAV